MIPVLDWSRFAIDPQGFAQDLGAACRETGFFLLKNHTIPAPLIADTFAAADALFALPPDAKHQIAIDATNRGWAALGTEALDDTTGRPDRKEAFNIGLDLPENDPRLGEPFRAPNRWPDLPGFRATCLAYYDAAHAQGVDLHRPLALTLGLPEHHFAPAFTAPLATLRLLHYPPATGTHGEIGAGAHTDYGSLTLLLTDGEPGLQVRPRGGDWTDVPRIPGTLTVNIGDCLMRWTNDTLISTPHRVLPPKRQRRSIAFFLDPNPDATIAALPGTGPAKYPPTTGAAYLRARLDATYGSTP